MIIFFKQFRIKIDGKKKSIIFEKLVKLKKLGDHES